METETEATVTAAAPDGCENDGRGDDEETGRMETDLPDYEEDEPDVGVLDAESGDDAGSTVSDQDGTDNNRSIKLSASGGTMEPISRSSNITVGTCNNAKITRNPPPSSPASGLGGKRDNVTTEKNNTGFPPQYYLIRAKKSRTVNTGQLGGVSPFSRVEGGGAGPIRALMFRMMNASTW
jgi:hypothetical protein